VPIHDQSYRHYLGGKALPGRAWMVIARAGIVNMIRKRAFLALLLASWLPFVFAVIAIYFTTNFPQAALFAPTAQRFREFLSVQEQFAFFITIYAGAGLIANDRRANALQIYLSKPLMRAEYIAGKAGVLFAFLLLVTFVPTILLLLVQATFAGSFQFVRANLFLIPAITVASLLFVVLSTSTILALSSLSKSSRYVAILYTGVVMFTWTVFNILYAITGSSAMSWISPTRSLSQVVDVIFRLKPGVSTPWQVSLLVVIGLIVLSISVLERRVRGVEVVT
jgi:ABC-type transport system involved in multi-copper enzyme maturation permease subunit